MIIILFIKRPWVETLEHIRSSCPLIHTHDPFKVKAYWLKSMYPQPYVPDIIRGQPRKLVVPHWSCCKHANSIEILEVVVFKPLPKIGFESIAKPSWAESIWFFRWLQEEIIIICITFGRPTDSAVQSQAMCMFRIVTEPKQPMCGNKFTISFVIFKSSFIQLFCTNVSNTLRYWLCL